MTAYEMSIGDRTDPRRVALRRAIASPELLVAPGVYDGLSARVAAACGFKALYISGGAVSRSTGIPDVGLLTMTEVLDRTKQIVEAVEIPVIADIDTGYGGYLNVARTVREFERVGVAGFHLEDQAIPKRCGHYEDKEVVEPGAMVARIHAAIDAREDHDLVIIARTDARAVEGLEKAIDRGKLYAEAGADMVFIEAPQSREEITEVARTIDAPLVINMFEGGKTPLMPASELEQLGYALEIVPSDLQRAAIYGMKRAAEALAADGSTASFASNMISFSEREELIDLEKYASLSDTYSAYERRN